MSVSTCIGYVFVYRVYAMAGFTWVNLLLTSQRFQLDLFPEQPTFSADGSIARAGVNVCVGMRIGISHPSRPGAEQAGAASSDISILTRAFICR